MSVFTSVKGKQAKFWCSLWKRGLLCWMIALGNQGVNFFAYSQKNFKKITDIKIDTYKLCL